MILAGLLHAENLTSIKDVKVTAQCESHSVYSRSLWVRKPAEEIYHKAFFVFFFFKNLL